MNQKSSLIYILIVLWLIVGIMFLGMTIVTTMNHLEQLDSMGSYMSGDDQWNTMMNFNFIMSFILYLTITIISFLLIYSIFFQKRQSWLISIMLASFLAFFVWVGINSVGNIIIMESFDQIFDDLKYGFIYITYIAMIFIVPCLLYILTRVNVKEYFENK